MDVYYLGPEGSYSHILAKNFFKDGNHTFHPMVAFKDIVDNVNTNRDAVGVLPIENSITSSVHENIDHIFNNNLKIVAEGNLLINLQLVGLNGTKVEEIKTVYSHPKALSQCTKFIKEHNLNQVETSSTAEGSKVVLEKNDSSNAAIGSRDLAENPALEIIAPNIGNEKRNTTRFVIISQRANENHNGRKKMTVIFKIGHKPGTLALMLTHLAAAKANLTKIESRPIPGTDWEYNFWVDLESDDVDKLSEVIKSNSIEYKILGVYDVGKTFES